MIPGRDLSQRPFFGTVPPDQGVNLTRFNYERCIGKRGGSPERFASDCIVNKDGGMNFWLLTAPRTQRQRTESREGHDGSKRGMQQ